MAVEQNLAAFRAGRASTADPECTQVVGHAGAGGTAPDPAVLAADLARYQSGRLAARYLELVDETRVAEERAGGGGSLAAAVAFGYHKLLAYKDEYEVARLLLDQPASDGKVTWLLHPPVLRSLGLSRKLRLGPRATPLLKGLQRARRLRGTPLDPFGHTELRRIERQLPAEYARTIRDLLLRLDTATLPQAVEIARLPGKVRGYEHVKLASIAAYRKELASRLAEACP